MKKPIRTTIVCLAFASVAIGAVNKTPQRLTPNRIAELTAPSDAPPPKAYKIVVSGLQRPSPTGSVESGPISVVLSADKPQGVVECISELRFPSAFTPPKALPNQEPPFKPTSPAEFDLVNIGWTIRLSARQHGRVVAVSGVADYAEAEMLTRGYGELAAPIYAEAGQLLSPNVLHQPKVQTTSTRFQIFAAPGETYEVSLYRGTKAEKHKFTVTTE